MSQLEKLRPDQDLQCYFERPSAIAAMSEASARGFTVSGTWRQAFDWAVIEWNRDNTFEHPLFRNLPDGDLSGLTLTYEETRSNCISLDSTVYPTVDWPYLRVWASSNGVEQVYKVSLKDYATVASGSYHAAHGEFAFGGELTVGDVIGLAWLDEQYNHCVSDGESHDGVVSALVNNINSLSSTVEAIADGNRVLLAMTNPTGYNGNRLGAYGFVSGARSEIWTPRAQTFAEGASPELWRIALPFGDMYDIGGAKVPTDQVRKLRWTYAADWQRGEYERSEFAVVVSDWTVSGNGRAYAVAGPGSVRVEDRSSNSEWFGAWKTDIGNYSDGTIRFTKDAGDSCRLVYTCGQSHRLYLGTRLSYNAASLKVRVDAGTAYSQDLRVPGEDVLARVLVGEFSAGTHMVEVEHDGDDGDCLYLDYVEAAVPSFTTPFVASKPGVTLATDWDTDHSICLAPERTAENIKRLGYLGRANHYVGALWFCELVKQGHSYASATVTFVGTPVFSCVTEIQINREGLPESSWTSYSHLNLYGETAEDVAKAFELVINNGSTGIRAESYGSALTLYARMMGDDGNRLTVAASPDSGAFFVELSGSSFSGGVEGEWRTDLVATPRLNRAVRDWTRSYFRALKGWGIEGTAAFSMELQHGDPSAEAGIAQRYPSGNAVVLTTPAIQTNFSPVSLEFWRQVYLDMANVMVEAGVPAYLQFGEVQWWYFPYDGSGLPFHDAYTRAAFQSRYGFGIRAIADGSASPVEFPEEAAFLPELIGSFTAQVMDYVRQQVPGCKFEVLFPTDVNEGAFNRVINYAPTWTKDSLDCLKTESFTYTGSRELDHCVDSMEFSTTVNFPREKRSHLIGIGSPTSCWMKETNLAESRRIESVVLFAFDQYCLIGYSALLPRLVGRSRRFR